MCSCVRSAVLMKAEELGKKIKCGNRRNMKKREEEGRKRGKGNKIRNGGEREKT